MRREQDRLLFKKSLVVEVSQQSDGNIRYTVIGDDPDDFRVSEQLNREEAGTGDPSYLRLFASNLSAFLGEVARETSKFVNSGKKDKKRRAS